MHLIKVTKRSRNSIICKYLVIADRKLKIQNQINSILASSSHFGVGFIAGFNEGLKRYS